MKKLINIISGLSTLIGNTEEAAKERVVERREFPAGRRHQALGAHRDHRGRDPAGQVGIGHLGRDREGPGGRCGARAEVVARARRGSPKGEAEEKGGGDRSGDRDESRGGGAATDGKETTSHV